MSTGTLTVCVATRTTLIPDIHEFELRKPESGPLPGFTPGAHINVDTPGGARRSYSLTGSPDERDRYLIAVAREARGRGGSASMVDDAAPGTLLRISAPVNRFALRPASRYLLIAGGIGITPLRAMHDHLRRTGDADVRLLYLTRSPESTAYLDEFAGACGVTVRHSKRHGRLDLWPYLAEPDDGTRIYCCGPDSLKADVRALTMHWRPSLVHFEDFAGVSATDGTSRAFTATWRPTGHTVDVPATTTLLNALRDADPGLGLPSSCESGTCGTCRLRLHDGEAEHRDLVLDDREHAGFVIPCVSRAAGEHLTIGPA